MNILKQRRVQWLQRVLNKTVEERKISMWQRLMRRMRNINPRTHTSYTHIGRNDPCPCGNVYAGIWLRDKFGASVKGEKGEDMEKPVKFKHCCISKYVGLKPGVVTPEMVAAQKKQKVYFEKTGKVVTV